MYISISNFKKIVSNSVRMYHISLVILKCSQLFQLQNFFLIASEYTIYCSCFQLFLIFFFQKHRSKCARMQILVSLVSKLSQQCQLWFISQCFRWWADILPSINIDYTCNLLSLLIVDHIDRSVTQTRWMFALLNMFNFQNTSAPTGKVSMESSKERKYCNTEVFFS